MRNLLQTQGSFHARKSARAGFTLVELMTVAAVILILVSLLAAALNKTQSKALRLTCLQNTRQLQTAWLMYTDDNDQRFPLNRSVPTLKQSKLIGSVMSSNSWVAGNPRIDLDDRNIRAGTLFPYAKNPEVYRCPMDDSRVFNRPDLERTRSYSISSYLSGDGAGFDPAVKVKFDELINPRPENIFVFIEEHEASLWIGGFNVLERTRLTIADIPLSSTPADRHNQGCHVSFADGHVEYWKWYAPKTELASGPSLTKHSASTLNDLRRLQSCTPLP